MICIVASSGLSQKTYMSPDHQTHVSRVFLLEELSFRSHWSHFYKYTWVLNDCWCDITKHDMTTAFPDLLVLELDGPLVDTLPGVCVCFLNVHVVAVDSAASIESGWLPEQHHRVLTHLQDMEATRRPLNKQPGWQRGTSMRCSSA